MEGKKLVPDTSVIVDGRITGMLKAGGGRYHIIVPNAVVAELEYQANLGREIGIDGLRELESLQKLAEKKEIHMDFSGERPGGEEIRNAKTGMIDELVRRAAKENEAILVTSDSVQAMVARAKGIDVEYIESKITSKPKVFELFDKATMSVHLKENNPVYAKRGSVGSFELVRIGGVVDRKQINQYAREIMEYTSSNPLGFIEMEHEGATVIQVEEYRIVITRPPFSDGIEITAVKPIKKTTLDDYNLTPKLKERLDGRAEGIFVSGSPGAGKSTFAQALAEFYQKKGKIVKTMEKPRDLQVGDFITQYGPLEGSMEKTSDILLLVRPDYTIFDEVRKTDDFKVFADMRLAGVGLVGVTHARKAIDSIQRLVGRVELGVIPHVIDTVIHIDKGEIQKVFELSMTVKVPVGMTESDLSRPVIQVRDFETGRPEYEIYSYGDEVVVIPIGRREEEGRERYGRQGRSREPQPDEIGVAKTKKAIILRLRQYRDMHVKLYAGGEYVLTGRVNMAGNLKVKRNTLQGRMLADALNEGREITASS